MPTDKLISALGEAVAAVWGRLPGDVQQAVFEAAIGSAGEGSREKLAIYLHDRHLRTPLEPIQVVTPGDTGLAAGARVEAAAGILNLNARPRPSAFLGDGKKHRGGAPAPCPIPTQYECPGRLYSCRVTERLREQAATAGRRPRSLGCWPS